MAWKFLKFLEEKSSGIFRKMQDNRDPINESDWPGKCKQVACKTLRVSTKNEENFEKVQENSEIFWSKSLWKMDCFTIFTQYFLDFWLRSESIDLWKITPNVYNNFSDFGGGGDVPASPLLPTLLLVEFNTGPSPALEMKTFFYDSSVLFKGSTFSSYFPYNKNSIYLLIALQMFSNFSQNSLNISFSVQKLSRWNAKLFHNSSLNVSKISSNFSKILHRPGGSTTPPHLRGRQH